MKNRKKRVELMVELIKTRSIGSQEELSNALYEHGYKVTQATLSRDMKMLKISKVATDSGSYMYILPDSNDLKDKLLANGHHQIRANHQTGFVSLTFSGNLAVIKTRNGYAQGIAYDIEMCNPPEILGTVPGTNTIIAVLREGITHEQATHALSKVLPIDRKVPIY